MREKSKLLKKQLDFAYQKQAYILVSFLSLEK